jgi:hypothetical protein
MIIKLSSEASAPREAAYDASEDREGCPQPEEKSCIVSSLELADAVVVVVGAIERDLSFLGAAGEAVVGPNSGVTRSEAIV